MIEDVCLLIVVLWRNKEGFEGMMNVVLEQAAGRQTKLIVEVHCFKRGWLMFGNTHTHIISLMQELDMLKQSVIFGLKDGWQMSCLNWRLQPSSKSNVWRMIPRFPTLILDHPHAIDFWSVRLISHGQFWTGYSGSQVLARLVDEIDIHTYVISNPFHTVMSAWTESKEWRMTESIPQWDAV